MGVPVIKPGSVTRRHGHLRIETAFSLNRCGTNRYRFQDLPYHDTVSEFVVRGWPYALGRFFCSGPHTYYVDGNYGVWETDIVHIWDVVFDPVCREKDRVIGFRKLHKLEWLFA
jgi:hypothetical protein